MKRILIIVVAFCTAGHVFAQGTIKITGSTRLVTTGGVQVVLGGGTLTNDGTISSSGSGSTWILSGPVILSGTGITAVSNLVINHTYGISQLNAPVTVSNTANLVAGTIQLGNNLLLASSQNTPAVLVVTGVPNGNVQGLMTSSTVTSGGCPTYSADLSVNITGSSLNFQWQRSADSLSWSNVAGATSSTYTATVSSAPVFYRCNITGGTSYNDTSKAVKLAFDLPDATISGVSSVLVGNTATLTAATAGGTWSSDKPAVLTVNSSSGLITGISSGSATVTYTVANGSGCSASATKLITVGNGAKPNVVVTDPAAVCAPATVDLTAAAVTAGSDPNLTYTYFTDAAGNNALATPAAVSASGTYYIKGTNSSNVASDLMPVVVTINPLPSGVISSALGNVLCGTGASLTLDASGGSTYAWRRNGIAITGVTGSQLTITTTGVYTATVTTASGCTAPATNSLTITAVQKPVADFSFDSYCINRPVTFTSNSTVAASGTVSYLWTDNNNNTSTATAPVFTYAQASSFSMTLKVTPQACPALADAITKQFTVEVPRVAVRMQPPSNAVINEPLPLPARNFGKAYLWSPATGLSNPNSGTPSATLTADQDYRIQITAPSGCITVDSLLVRIYDNRIYVPTVFTPNGDGVNDKLFVNLAGIRQLRYFRVFNRFGKMVFQTTDPTIGWDGRFNNDPQPIDTYIWAAEVADQFGVITRKTGNVTLLR
ncbi:MAG: T9SS type B sorting domain-containing protein [Chitinophagaceae bacterium]|nr:T9SS type B sorting domain-containing protein [Chitinophagaceae bacterium]